MPSSTRRPGGAACRCSSATTSPTSTASPWCGPRAASPSASARRRSAAPPPTPCPIRARCMRGSPPSSRSCRHDAMGRLIVVSNRVALPGTAQSGGLATALRAALSQRGGVWFGWSGEARAKVSGDLHEQTDGRVRYLTMDLSRRDHDAYYTAFSNRTLWPLLHFRPDLVDYT